MLVLLSPAKSLDFTTPAEVPLVTEPDFGEQSCQLIDRLRQLSSDELASLMKLSSKLTELNRDRYSQFQWPIPAAQGKAAVLAFTGDVYQGLEATTLSQSQLQQAQQQIRILSGLYGLLRPLDVILPYRLEMGTALTLPELGTHTLYQFWGERLTQAINEQLTAMSAPCLVNLASQEYFRAVQAKALCKPLIEPRFLDSSKGKLKVISFYAKKARGLMARYIVQQQPQNPQDLQAFAAQGYQYSSEHSSAESPCFIRWHD